MKLPKFALFALFAATAPMSMGCAVTAEPSESEESSASEEHLGTAAAALVTCPQGTLYNDELGAHSCCVGGPGTTTVLGTPLAQTLDISAAAAMFYSPGPNSHAVVKAGWEGTYPFKDTVWLYSSFLGPETNKRSLITNALWGDELVWVASQGLGFRNSSGTVTIVASAPDYTYFCASDYTSAGEPWLTSNPSCVGEDCDGWWFGFWGFP